MTNQRIGILIINGPLPPPFGGVATYLAHALPYLAENDFEIHTVIDQKPPDPKQYEQFERKGVHIHYGGGTRLQRALRIIRHTPLWIATLRKSGISFFLLLKTVKSIVRWLDVSEQILQHHTIHIIHAYDYPWVQGFVAAHLAKKYKKKYVQTTFGEVVPHKEELVHHDTFGDQYKPFARHVLAQSDLIISLSQHCAKEIEYVGIPQDKVRVTYWGVDVNHFHPDLHGEEARKQYALGNFPMMLFLGQVRLRKGPQILVEAASQVIQRFPSAKFLIVGPDYGIVKNLKERAAKLGITHAVSFLGGKEHDELPALYAACDIFVFPTCTPIECLGLSMIQAMASGKPVVGSRINGIPEVIVDGSTGFLVEPNNPGMLAEKILLLLENEALRKTMGESARRRAEEFFNQEKLVTELKNLYYEVVRVN